MIWSGWKIKENCTVLVSHFRGNFHCKALSCRKIRSVSREMIWCFNASWGLKGLSAMTLLAFGDVMLVQCRKRWPDIKPTLKQRVVGEGGIKCHIGDYAYIPYMIQVNYILPTLITLISNCIYYALLYMHMVCLPTWLHVAWHWGYNVRVPIMCKTVTCQ